LTVALPTSSTTGTSVLRPVLDVDGQQGSSDDLA
jgi:hypothetical protein